MLVGTLAPAKAGTRVGQKTPTAQAAKERGPDTAKTVVHQRGIASWYGRRWRGKRTASGARFNDRALTAAHRWLPFATRARVTNLENGRSVEVVVNDRGPYHGHRIIDLSAHAAELLGMKKSGLAEVSITATVPTDETRLGRIAMR